MGLGPDKKALANGSADIVDWGQEGLYEIKPFLAEHLGVATMALYIVAWNSAVEHGVEQGPYLTPGKAYPPPLGVIVGTDPDDPQKWIIGELAELGVIVYYDVIKKYGQARVMPQFVFEWQPETQSVQIAEFASETNTDSSGTATVPVGLPQVVYSILDYGIPCAEEILNGAEQIAPAFGLP